MSSGTLCRSCRWPGVPVSPSGAWPPSTTSGEHAGQGHRGQWGRPPRFHPPNLRSPLRTLRQLDVTGLRVPSPGLVQILLEEALPGCRVLGLDIGDSAETGTAPRGTQPPT